MAVAHDAATRWPTTNGTTGVSSLDTTTGDRTFTHTPSGTPKGAVVMLNCTGTSAAWTGVLYGGVAMNLIVSATDTSEAQFVQIFFIPAGIAAGAATVTIQGCTATGKWATCCTVTASTSMTRLNGVIVVDTTTAANPAAAVVTNIPAAAETLSYAITASGAAAPATAVDGSSTLLHSQDHGALMANTARTTTAATANPQTITFTVASDDFCVAGMAFAEFEPIPQVFTQNRVV